MEKGQIHGIMGTDSIVMKASIVAVIDLVLAAAVVLPSTILAQEELPNEATGQKTLTSTQDPSPGHVSHEAAIVLSPRTDSSVWVGGVTWTTRRPVEVVVLHSYNDSAVTNGTASQFEEPLTVLFGEGGEVAITLVKFDSGTRVDSASADFASNVLAFHTLRGDLFTTIYYTVNAAAE